MAECKLNQNKPFDPFNKYKIAFYGHQPNNKSQKRKKQQF